jgi:hypothetical protein
VDGKSTAAGGSDWGLSQTHYENREVVVAAAATKKECETSETSEEDKTGYLVEAGLDSSQCRRNRTVLLSSSAVLEVLAAANVGGSF